MAVSNLLSCSCSWWAARVITGSKAPSLSLAGSHTSSSLKVAPLYCMIRRAPAFACVQYLASRENKSTACVSGTHGGSYNGDIAIDDVKILNGPCDQLITTSSTPATTLPPKVDTFKCDFEANICTFVQVEIVCYFVLSLSTCPIRIYKPCKCAYAVQ